MTTRRAALIVTVIVGSQATVLADDLASTRDQAVREVAHSVEIQIADGVAHFIVQRQFKNPGKLADEVRLAIALPEGAAATGLRIRAKQKWHEGELLARDLAADRYRELTGQGVNDPKDPALLFWVSSSELFLQVFPVMPGTVSTVEYTLTVPTRYTGGRYRLDYPRAIRVTKGSGSLQLARPVITVRSSGARETVMIDGRHYAANNRASLAFPSPLEPPPTDEGTGTEDTTVESDELKAPIGVVPPAIATWAGRLGRVVASDKQAFTRLEVDVAPQLSAIPRRAQVVFVVDTSYSAGAELLAAQLAIVRAYVKHGPDADVEVIAYRRAAQRVFGKFVPAREVARTLDEAMARGALALGNGSALDAGAKLAAAALAGRAGPHRIVITTDDLLRESLSEAAALQPLAAIDPAAIVHVVVPSIDKAAKPTLARDDSATLAPLASTHHGIFARLSVAPARHDDLAVAVLELVRPIRIDQIAVTGGLSVEDELHEGEGIRLFVGKTKLDAPTKVTLSGKLWSDPVRLDVTESARFSKATAAFVFGADLHNSLSEAELMTVALAGRAVSPVTSYLAIEPGVRPSKIGLEGGGTGWGTIGTGRYGTIGGSMSHGSTRTPPDLASMIDTKACVKPPGAWAVKLEIETTRDEIVDVEVGHASAGTRALADCMVEAAWKVRLDRRFDQVRETFQVDLSD